MPFRANNTGNFLGWYDVEGRKTNAVPVTFSLGDGSVTPNTANAWVMNGELQTNDAALNNRFAIYSTPGNAVIYIDYVRANDDAVITAEKGGLMAISVDEMTKTSRTFYYNPTITQRELDGTTFTTLSGSWVNVDNTFGIVSPRSPLTLRPSSLTKQFAFGERANNNSVMTAKLYASYSDTRREVSKGSLVDSRAVVYYSNISAEQTSRLASEVQQLACTSRGWNGIIVPDPSDDGNNCYHMLLSNFASDSICTLKDICCPIGKPVFSVLTTIGEAGSSATFTANENHSVVNTLKFFVSGTGVEAIQEHGNPDAISLRSLVKGKNRVEVTAMDNGKKMTKVIMLGDKNIRLSISRGKLKAKVSPQL